MTSTKIARTITAAHSGARRSPVNQHQIVVAVPKREQVGAVEDRPTGDLLESSPEST